MVSAISGSCARALPASASAATSRINLGMAVKNVSTRDAVDQQAGDRIVERFHFSDRRQRDDFDGGLLPADAVQKPRKIVFEMAAHPQKHRGDGNALMTARRQPRDAFFQCRLHQLEESQLHREIRTGTRDLVADGLERFGPPGLARAVREQYQRCAGGLWRGSGHIAIFAGSSRWPGEDTDAKSQSRKERRGGNTHFRKL